MSDDDSGRLTGKVAVITGATAGIGEATAELFAREGARVVLAARREDKLAQVARHIESAGGDALAVPTDVTRVDDCKQLCEAAVDRFGRMDVLVNNAGIVDQHTPAIRVTDELWDNVVSVNLSGTFYLCREFLLRLQEGQVANIVNVSSIAGVYGNGGAAYSASKYGVIGLTKNIAIQYSGTGVRCNAVCPGPTPTELNLPEKLEHFDREFMEICARHTDMTVGESDVSDQAEAILYLASDAARYVTGQVLVVDRGMCL
jgi:NAD(P)-dependent dehydrogenase (short-subunit alcohol dehydrogenase family)